jgi:SNF2 family DNA or RNA helicase
MGVESVTPYMTEIALRWARAAWGAEQIVRDVHERIARGERHEFPWRDTTGDPETGAYRAPYDHQKVMASVAMWLDGVAIIGEMGTGKTRALLEAAQAKVRSGDIEQVVIFCKNSTIGVWESQCHEWTPLLRPVRLDDSMTIVERKNLLQRTHARGTMFIINYEVVYRMADALRVVFQRRRIGFVCDESQKIKNPHAKVTKCAIDLTYLAPWRVIMTGSPILQGVQDVWSQWYVVDLGTAFGANYVQYKREFFDENPWARELIMRPGSDTEVGLRMRRRGVRYLKEDCLDLPPKIYEVEYAEMTPGQKRAYRQMSQTLCAALSGDDPFGLGDGAQSVATAANQLAAILRLSQITSGFLPTEDGRIHTFEPNAKLTALLDWIEDIPEDKSVIIWAWYRQDITRIDRALREKFGVTPSIVQGGQSSAQRDDEVRKFASGQNRFFLGNPASGGAGLNLQRASYAAYYSQSYSLEHRIQSEDRCHRIGSEQHQCVTYVDFVCRDSVDEIVRDALARKANLADVVVDLRRHIGADNGND